MPTLQLNPSQRYRPPFTNEDDLGPDYAPLQGTAQTYDDYAGQSADKPEPVDTTPSLAKDSMNGVAKLPAAPPAGTPSGGAGPTGGAAEAPDPENVIAPDKPKAMKGGPPSALQEMQDKYNSVQPLKRPHDNLLQTIGKTALQFTKFAPIAEQIIHPKYAAQASQQNREQADLENKLKLSGDTTRVLTGQQNADSEDKNRQERIANEKQRIKDLKLKADEDREIRKQGLAEKLLEHAKDHIYRIPAATPPLTDEEKSNGVMDVDDFTGDKNYRMRLETHFGKIKVDDPEMAKYLHFAPGQLVDVNEYARAAIAKGQLEKDKKAPTFSKERAFFRLAGGDPDNESTATPEILKKYETISKEHPIVINSVAQQSALDRELDKFSAPHKKIWADANSQLDKIDEASMMVRGGAIDQALGVPKVMTALLTGAGSGLRITKSELEGIAHARGIMGDIEGTLRSWAGEGKLTPDQQKALAATLEGVKQLVLRKRQMSSETLDSFNAAQNSTEMRGIDSAYRKRIMDLEAPQNKTATYKKMAVGPDGHQIGSNDGEKTWFDVKTGAKI